jgi:hypothetical protein
MGIKEKWENRKIEKKESSLGQMSFSAQMTFLCERITMPKRGGLNWAFLKSQQKLNPKHEPNFTQTTSNK